MTLLPPNSSGFERAFEQVVAGHVSDVVVPVADIWSDENCPADFLPYLAWGLSTDLWDSAWSEAEKRQATAQAIAFQRCKGTKASLRYAIDLIDPLITITEWFEDTTVLSAHTFRLDLPTMNESAVVYDSTVISRLLRDIDKVKPLRSHFIASFRIQAQAHAGIVPAMVFGGYSLLRSRADDLAAQDPVWSTYLQDEHGQPLQDRFNEFLVAA